MSISAAYKIFSLLHMQRGMWLLVCMERYLHREISELLEIPVRWILSDLLPIEKPVQQSKVHPPKPLDKVYKLIK